MFAKLALSTAVVLGLTAFAQAESVKWTAALDQAQEVDKAAPAKDAKGAAEGTLDTETGDLTWKVTFEGLSGASTGVHFHGPAKTGADAGVVVDIASISGMESPSEGKAKITPEQVKELTDGMWYVNVHTAANPKGEIRGQVAVAK